MPARLLMRLEAWLEEKGTPIHLGVDLEEISEHGVRIRTKAGEELTIAADDVVLALPQRPNTELERRFAGAAPEIHMVGPESPDHPWLIVDAVAGGFRVGNSI